MAEKPYDSTQDTLEHIRQVQKNLQEIISQFANRGIHHDISKLKEPEKSVFDKVTLKLKALTYGSEEYKKSLSEMGIALAHHYENNSHHPEYYQDGINDMSLLDIFEMLCDWKAATLRHANGDMQKSLKINSERFNMSPQLVSIFEKTIKELGW